MSGERYCRNADCGAMLVRRSKEEKRAFDRRSTCGPHCGAKAGQQKMRAHGITRGPYEPREREIYHWTRPQGELTASFYGMDVKVNDGRVQKLVRPDANQSLCGSAADMCAI